MSQYTSMAKVTGLLFPLVSVGVLWHAPAAVKGHADEPKKASSRLVFDLHSFPEELRDSPTSYEAAFHDVMAFTENGRWIAVPVLTTRKESETHTNEKDLYNVDGQWLVAGKRTGTHVITASVRLIDLHGPGDQEHPSWPVGGSPLWHVGGIPAAIAAGPHNSIAFQVEKSRTKFVELKDRKIEVVFERPRYVRVVWCGTGKSAFYRLPSDNRIIRLLWFSENPTTGEPNLFGLLSDSSIARWHLENRGAPPDVHELVVERAPVTRDVRDVLAAAAGSYARDPDAECRIYAAVKGHSVAYLTAETPRRVRVIRLDKKQVMELHLPTNAAGARLRDIILSPDGNLCVGIARNSMYAWSVKTGRFIWSSKVADGHFIHRCCISNDATKLVTWSYPFPYADPRPRSLEQHLSITDLLQARKQATKGVLTIFDAMTGEQRARASFPLPYPADGLAVAPDGRRVAVLGAGQLTVLDAKLPNDETK